MNSQTKLMDRNLIDRKIAVKKHILTAILFRFTKILNQKRRSKKKIPITLHYQRRTRKRRKHGTYHNFYMLVLIFSYVRTWQSYELMKYYLKEKNACFLLYTINFNKNEVKKENKNWKSEQTKLNSAISCYNFKYIQNKAIYEMCLVYTPLHSTMARIVKTKQYKILTTRQLTAHRILKLSFLFYLCVLIYVCECCIQSEIKYLENFKLDSILLKQFFR